MKFFRCYWLLPLLFAGWVSVAWGQESVHVLLLNSYHFGLDWTDNETAGVREVLEKSGRPIELHIEFMDSKRQVDATHLSNFRQLLAYKFRNTRLAAILVTDNDAFNFLRQYHNERMFEGVPVIFAGINFFQQEMLKGLKGYTGVVETFEAGQTVSLMQRLHPAVKRIVVVIDSTATGLAIRKDLEPMLVPFAGQINFEFWDQLSLAQMRERLPALDQHTLILLMPFAMDSAGNYIRYAELAEMVSQLSPVPVYGTYDFYMGFGIVGGRLTQGDAQGRAAAQMLLRVLDGVDPGQIPVMTVSPSEFRFDARQLHRYGIATAELPPESLILFQSWYEQHRNWLWLGGLLSAITLLLGWGLSRTYRFKRQGEIALRESEEKLRTLLDCSSNAIFIVEGEGHFTFVNRQAELLLGYSSAELLRMRFHDTLPTEDREYVIPALQGKLSGALFFETVLLQKDGRRIIVEINVMSLPGTDVLLELSDITERKQAEQNIQRNKEQLATILNAPTESIFHIDEQGIILAINNIAAQRVKMEPGEMIGRCTFDFFPEEVAASRRESVAEVFCTGKRKYTEDTRQGHHYSLTYYPIIDNIGKVESVVVYAADITERKHAEMALLESHQQMYSLLNSMAEGAYGVDIKGKCTFVNRSFLKIMGYDSADEIIGKNMHALIHHSHADGSPYVAAECKMYIAFHRNQESHVSDEVFWTKQGKAIPVEYWSLPILVDNEIQGAIATFVDISERKLAEAQIHELAFYDTLTRLPNRRLLNDRLDQALASCKRSGHYGALLFLDLDNFKPLNDTYGHDAGDLLLIEAAHRLSSCIRETDTVARFGGDEFVVLLRDLRENLSESTAQVSIIAEKIATCLSEAYQLKIKLEDNTANSVIHYCTASIGVVMFNQHAHRANILKWADMAMYQAKDSGRNSVVINPKVCDA